MTERFSQDDLHLVYESPTTHKRYPVITAGYALQQRPAIEWMVDGLFQPSSLGMIVGQFGIGKTYAALDIAVCVARGDAWMGKPTKRATVLIIDEESGDRRISDRLGATLRGHDAGNDTDIFVMSFAGFTLMDDEGVVEMCKAIEHFQAKLVIIDALADIIPGADENSVKEIMPALIFLREIAERTSACIVLLHHVNKGGEYRGSTAIAAKVDVMLKMERIEKSNSVKFSFTKARDVEQHEVVALMNFESDRFWMSQSNVDASEQIRLSRSQQYVIDYLGKHSDALMADIMNRADSCSENAARQAVYTLVTLKLVRRTDGGGNGVAATYGLVNLSKNNARQVDDF